MTARYVKLTQAHGGYAAVLATCRTAFLAAHPNNDFSMTQQPEGALVWVKTTTGADLSLGGAVLDIQDGSNSRARTDVAAWFPPPEFPA